MRLEPGIFADAIRMGRAAAPNPQKFRAAENMIRDALDGTLIADTDSVATRSLIELLGPYASLVSDEAQKRLCKTVFIVAPANLFVACAHRSREHDIIVVFEGLLDVIILVTEMAHVVANLPVVFKEVFPNPHYPG